MFIKRWIAVMCLTVMFASVIFLMIARSQLYASKADLAAAQQKLHDVQAELDALKNSTAGNQAEEIANLRKQNDALSAKASALQQNVERMQHDSLDTAQHLSTARSALEMQQEHLQQLQAAQQQQQQQQQETANTAACIANLKAIDAAKQLWALDKNKAPADVPTTQDLMPYFKEGNFPVCPDGGNYIINSMSELPTCTVPGHVLPAN